MSTLFLFRGPKAAGKTTLANALSKKIGAVQLNGDKLYMTAIFKGLTECDINKAYARLVSREAMRHIRKGIPVIIDRNMSLECTNAVMGRLKEKNVPVELCDVLGEAHFQEDHQGPDQPFEQHPHALFIDTQNTPVEKAIKSIVGASDVDHPVHTYLLKNEQIRDFGDIEDLEESALLADWDPHQL